jgi:hypothetical protein
VKDVRIDGPGKISALQGDNMADAERRGDQVYLVLAIYSSGLMPCDASGLRDIVHRIDRDRQISRDDKL